MFILVYYFCFFFFFFQAEDGIRDYKVTGVQTCALPIFVLEQRDERAGAPRMEPLRLRLPRDRDRVLLDGLAEATAPVREPPLQGRIGDAGEVHFGHLAVRR